MHRQPESQNRKAGGIFIALGLLVGAIAGLMLGQPSLGMVGGLAVGGLLALAVWLLDRK